MHDSKKVYGAVDAVDESFPTRRNDDAAKCQFQKWERKRALTTYVFYLLGFLLGMEYSAIVISLWFYLKDVLMVDHLSAYYSAGMTLMASAAVISGLGVSRIMDRNRNVRCFIFVVSVISVIGNIFYTLHYSVWFLLIGRFICGFGDSLATVISGEFSRVYPEDVLGEVLTKYITIYSIGFIIGPGTGIAFQKIDIYVGSWHLNNTNFFGIFMTILIIISNVLVYFFVSNLSQEYDLKALRESEEINERKKRKKDSQDKNPVPNDSMTLHCVEKKAESPLSIQTANLDFNASAPLTVKEILKNYQIMLIIISTAFLNYIGVTTDLLVPLLASRMFHWDMWHVSVTVAVCGVVYALLMWTCVAKMIKGRQKIYFAYVGSLLVACVGPIILTIPCIFTISELIAQNVLIVCAVLFNAFSGLSGIAFSRAIILQMSPGNSVTFCEGIRMAMSRLFGLIGLFSTSFLLPHLKIATPVITVLMLIQMILIIQKYQTYISKIQYTRLNNNREAV